MRFAVHRPGYPVASTRSHSVPRRDTADIPWEVKRRFLPGLKAGGWAPRS